MSSEFIAQLTARAVQNPKTIIFPESGSEKVLQASERLLKAGIARPILVGKRDAIEARAAELQVSTKGFDYVDNEDEAVLAYLIPAFLAVNQDFSEKALNRKFRNPLNFAAAWVKLGRADCLAAGIDCSTGDVVLASQLFIGLQDGISTVSSFGVVEAPGFETSEGNLFAIADCAVCQNPTASELSDIACTTADTMKSLLGWEPRAALVCFSTDGSGQHEITDKVKEGVRIANERRPDLAIDGEFQIDTALKPAVAAKKVRRPSRVAGRANIIVFPDLNAGNIGVKLIQMFGGALAHGPLLQGFARPVTDFSRSAPIDEIVGNLTILVVRAGE
ncbi:phosphate acyltransferase [Geothrix sp. 21YS21S-2]|uniref:phosphate acyltransferase n=1 Tax=Geothrix sp. 21YS21S-2 TaxID=3068893 RepID=UPI0027B89DD4|nr:phosphate acyltransferase [Geothrix sp. 21YS21S-2]